jgi:Tfp pilus assembly protein PilF
VLAMFFVQRGELKEAQAELEFALKLDPQMHAVQSALTEVERMMRAK